MLASASRSLYVLAAITIKTKNTKNGSVRKYVKHTEAIICFKLFSHQFSERFYGSYMIYSSDFDKIKNKIQN